MNTTQIELNQNEASEAPESEACENQLRELQQFELMLIGGGAGDVIF
ncbi:MAG: hypothetical protein JNM76_11340 [Betaproteobacteria bacterium]|nr:hypothetical protein [Betaproteobacteria bacterium]